ncbi:MAG: hypothetical protein D6705_15895 [Deltaproteobacteria bacterium]|nr:MAG: hypothetical protein D6705_15895 [Deltaproteobacteria bacterium]
MACRVAYGLDEAGRGPVIGPMALAIVGLSRRAAHALTDRGLADSKVFGSTPAGRRARAELAEAIFRGAAFVRCVLVPAFVVDAYTARHRLDDLEREVACELIDAARRERPGPVVCDGRRIFGPLRGRWTDVDARDRADADEPAVAAASIVAKHARDEALDAVLEPHQEAFGPIRGGGYANAATRRFLLRYLEARGTLPPHVRHTFLRGGFLGTAAQQTLPYGPQG